PRPTTARAYPIPYTTLFRSGGMPDAAKGTRREKLARWIASKDNPYFARSYVNRLWGYMLGVGLIDPVDDIRAGNPPTNPKLLDRDRKSTRLNSSHQIISYAV